MSDIRAAVRDFLLQNCLPGEPPESLPDDASLQEGILDSMLTLKLVNVIERAAGIEIEAHELTKENFASVDSIVEFVETKRGG